MALIGSHSGFDMHFDGDRTGPGALPANHAGRFLSSPFYPAAKTKPPYQNRRGEQNDKEQDTDKHVATGALQTIVGMFAQNRIAAADSCSG